MNGTSQKRQLWNLLCQLHYYEKKKKDEKTGMFFLVAENRYENC